MCADCRSDRCTRKGCLFPGSQTKFGNQETNIPTNQADYDSTDVVVVVSWVDGATEPWYHLGHDQK
jgi:hypothetical protein